MTADVMTMRAAPSEFRQTGVWLGLIGTLWAAAVIALAAVGVFDVPPHEAPLSTLIAIAVPVFAFVGAMLFVPNMRRLAMSLDPVLLTEFQAWRIVGGLFLAVYAFGHLPGVFALPAGLGDVAVGLAAPFMAWSLRTRPQFITSRRFRIFNYLGIADFVIAVTTGVAAREQIPGLVDQVTTGPMGQLPLVLIPTVAVPMFFILHLIVLMQIREQRQ